MPHLTRQNQEDINNLISIFRLRLIKNSIRTALIRHQCSKTTVLSCHRCLTNAGVEKMNKI